MPYPAVREIDPLPVWCMPVSVYTTDRNKNDPNDRDMSNYDFIKAGSKVFWHDPDGGLSDGVYQVVDVPEEIEEDSIILIASDYSEAEVFAAELSPL